MAKSRKIDLQTFDLHDTVGYLVARLFHAMHQEFSRGLAAHGVTPPHWATLITLYQKKASTPGGLARYLGVDRAAITRILDRLEEDGLVVRKPGTDRRSLSLDLTPAGRELTPRLAEVAHLIRDKFLSKISHEEESRFKSTLIRILKNSGIQKPFRLEGDHST
jgi:DNA-binding MarR family transcriptional regulator